MTEEFRLHHVSAPATSHAARRFPVGSTGSHAPSAVATVVGVAIAESALAAARVSVLSVELSPIAADKPCSYGAGRLYLVSRCYGLRSGITQRLGRVTAVRPASLSLSPRSLTRTGRRSGR